MKTLNIVGTVAGALFITAFIVFLFLILHWSYEEPKQLPVPAVSVVTQIVGAPILLEVPIRKITNVEDVEIDSMQVKLIDNKGNVSVQTQELEYQKIDRYKMLTYDKLSPGQYNMVLTICYKLNPIKSASQDFVIAVLSIKEDSNDNRTTTEGSVPNTNSGEHTM